MEHFTFYRALGLSGPAVVSAYGAGGKTTILQKLASEIAARNEKALLTTTTKMYRPPELPLFCEPDLDRAAGSLQKHFGTNKLAVLGNSILSDGKIEGIKPSWVEFLRDKLQVSVLVEADGAKRKSLKGYASHEPVLPASSDYIIAVLGGDALGKKISFANTHRLELFLKNTGTREGGEVNETVFAGAYQYMLEIGLAQAPRASVFFVINKGDLIASPGPSALRVAGLIKNTALKSRPERLLVTEGRDSHPVKITLNLKTPRSPVLVSCIVLAAGASLRMGRDKLKLAAGNKNLLEHTVSKVLASGIRDLVIVTSPGKADSIRPFESKRNKGLNIKYVENPYFKEGMSTSLKAGLEAVDLDSQGAIFALADQPHLPARIYNLICRAYMDNLALVTCPVYRGHRGNPALFDRRIWPVVMRMTGDQGGRAVFRMIKKEEVNYVKVKTPAVLLDIDSPEDYLLYLDNFSGIDPDHT